MSENVKVAVRVRPFNDRESSRQSKLIIRMSGNQTSITDPSSGQDKKFAFDYSYWSHDGFKERPDGYLEAAASKYADQIRVFDDLGRGVLANAWKGYNCSLFAYGQTGSGKSYSMIGYGANKGIVPVACEELFRAIDEKRPGLQSGEEFQVSLSMIEIYNEQVRDLLISQAVKGGLKVRQHPTKGFYVEQLSTAAVSSYAQIEAKIAEGTHNRTVAATNMNATSSRAHTIVAISFVQKTRAAGGQNMTKASVMNLVDLAGSERADSTGATGDRLKEGSAINLCGVGCRLYVGSWNWKQSKLKCDSEFGLVIMADVIDAAEMSHVDMLHSVYGSGVNLWLGGYQPAGSSEPFGGWYWVGCNITLDNSLWKPGNPLDTPENAVGKWGTPTGLADMEDIKHWLNVLCECVSPF